MDFIVWYRDCVCVCQAANATAFLYLMHNVHDDARKDSLKLCVSLCASTFGSSHFRLVFIVDGLFLIGTNCSVHKLAQQNNKVCNKKMFSSQIRPNVYNNNISRMTGIAV